MLDALKEDSIVKKVGGRFKLAALVQKRMIALNAGARPLVNVIGGDRMAIVLKEIAEGKIALDTSGVLVTNEGGDDQGDLDEGE
jgi:DNA-directed RNA polymerase subunit omega